MKQCTTIQMRDVQHILTSLQELDTLYHTDSLDVYEQKWKVVEQQVRLAFPGFTLAYAEIYTTGVERKAHGGMRHVLVPQQRV